MSRLVGKDSSQSSEKNSFDRIRIPQIFSNSKEYECSNCQRKFDKSYKAYNEARNLCEDCSDIFTPQIGV